MQLKLNRPLVIFDIESTGMSISNDRIVELAMIKVFPDGTEEERLQRFNPTIPIPQVVSEIHGIYDEDVKNEHVFSEKAKEISDYLQGCDFGGFNSNKFDFPMLVEEMLRANVDFGVEDRKFVDVQRIFHQMERRDLTAAYKFYCEKNLENAHSAQADTRATLDVLIAQIERYDAIENDIDFLHNFSGQTKSVDLSGRMIFDSKGREIFNFGKHKGKIVTDVLRVDPGYYKWIMENDFALDTKRRLTQIKSRA